MIRELIQAGFRLSGKRDPVLMRGLGWAVAEGFMSAVPYALLYILLSELNANRLSDRAIVLISALMLMALILRILAGTKAMPLIFSGAYRMMGEARLRLADHLRGLPLGWFSHQRAGDLGARLTSDLELVEHLWSHFLGIFVAGLAMPVFLLMFLFWVDSRLALVTLASLPLALLALYWTQKSLARSAPAMIQANADAQSALLEYLQGIAVIRGFGRFGQAFQALQQCLSQQHDAMLMAESRPAPWLAAFGFALELGYLLIILAAVYWLGHSTLSSSGMIIFLVLALPVYHQLFEAGLATLLLRFARRAMQRIEDILAVAPVIWISPGQQPDGQDISFSQVSFAHDGQPVLHGLSCYIPANTVTAIVGPSGAGKTTLVHLLARLWDVDKGSICIGGTDIRQLSAETLCQQIAMVFQDVVLFAGSVADNIRLGRPDADDQEVIRVAQQARAHDFIMALPDGYQTLLDENGSSLSGGERQRLSIARALLLDAPILLLDEATANIDPSAAAEIQQALTHLAQGRTVIVIAHHLRTICDADQILVLNKGRLQEQGNHHQLLHNQGLYARLWQQQQAARGWQLRAATHPAANTEPQNQ